MTAVLGIHGIAQQQLGPNQLLGSWKPALRDGIDLAIGRHARKEFKPKLDMSFYGDLFLPAGYASHKGGPIGDLDPKGLTSDDISFFEEIGEHVADPILDPIPTNVDKGFKELPPSIAKLFTWLDARFGAAAPVLFIGELSQVRRYQKDDQFAELVRARVLDLLDGAEVVIGHSLGSVVAYETLALNPAPSVRRLLTLGSPLSLPSVHRHLRARHSLAVGWINVYDHSDPVACAGGLSTLWTGVRDIAVDNQNSPHMVERYLAKRETGFAIAGRMDAV